MYNCYSPAETAEIVSRAGVIKANARLDKIFMSGVMAGMLLSFACATALSTNTAPWYQSNAPGLIRTLSALVFPYGLCMIVLTGSELCTGSFLVCSPTWRAFYYITDICLVHNRFRSSPSPVSAEDAYSLDAHIFRQPGGFFVCRGYHRWLWWHLLRRSVPHRDSHLRFNETTHARLAPDLLASHRRKLARLSSMLPGHERPRASEQDNRHLVADFRFRELGL